MSTLLTVNLVLSSNSIQSSTKKGSFNTRIHVYQGLSPSLRAEDCLAWAGSDKDSGGKGGARLPIMICIMTLTVIEVLGVKSAQGLTIQIDAVHENENHVTRNLRTRGAFSRVYDSSLFVLAWSAAFFERLLSMCRR